MNDSELLEELLFATQELGVEILWKEGDFTGGFCRLKDRRLLVLSPSLPVAKKIDVICQGLARIDHSRVFLRPVIRQRIETCQKPSSDNSPSTPPPFNDRAKPI